MNIPGISGIFLIHCHVNCCYEVFKFMLYIQARKKVTSNKQANTFNMQTEKAHKSRNKSPEFKTT